MKKSKKEYLNKKYWSDLKQLSSSIIIFLNLCFISKLIGIKASITLNSLK